MGFRIDLTSISVQNRRRKSSKTVKTRINKLFLGGFDLSIDFHHLLMDLKVILAIQICPKIKQNQQNCEPMLIYAGVYHFVLDFIAIGSMLVGFWRKIVKCWIHVWFRDTTSERNCDGFSFSIFGGT